MKKFMIFVLAVVLAMSFTLQNALVYADGSNEIKAEQKMTVDLGGLADLLEAKGRGNGSVSVMMNGTASTAASSARASSLTDEELAAVLYTGAKNLLSGVSLAGYNVTISQLERGMQLIFWYKPELFYLSPSYSYSYYGGTDIVATAYLAYTMTNDEIKAARVVYENCLNEIVAQVDSSWSQMEKVLFIHNWIAVNCEYDTSHTLADAYSMLTVRTGVCQGYSLLFGALMTKLGIGVDYVVSSELGHMWNAVCVDGSWYHLDLTWDDPVYVSGGTNPGVDRLGKVCYDYFLLTDEQITDSSHSSWSCGAEISTEAFTGGFYENSQSDCVYLDGKWYFINSETRRLNCYDSSTASTTDLLISTGLWYVWGSSSRYYTAAYSGLTSWDGKLYFNTRDSIKRFDPADGKAETVLTADVSDGYVYGMRSKGDGLVEYELTTASDLKASEVLTCYVGELELVEGSECSLGDYVTGLEGGTTVEELIAQFTQQVEVYNSNGDRLLEDETLKTGDRVCVAVDGVTYLDVSVAVEGDVDGTGTVDSLDYIKTKLQLKFDGILSDVFYAAADVDGNGTADSADALALKQRLRGN